MFFPFLRGIQVTGASSPETSIPPPSYTSHSPIVIHTPAQFDAQASAESWPGDGSSGNPYIIENYLIDLAGSVGNCIEISSHDNEYAFWTYFVIRNCILRNSSGSGNLGWGIFLMNTRRLGDIYNNTVVECERGSIALGNHGDGHYNTEITYQQIVRNNTCDGKISLQWGRNNKVINNTCYDISLYFGGGTIGNVVANNICNRIQTGSEDFTIVTNNTCETIAINGYNVDVTGNICDSATAYGGNVVFDYNFYSEYTGPDADGDGIGDIPHSIAGTAGSSDQHPLMIPFNNPFPIWLQSPSNQIVEFGEGFRYDINATAYPPGLNSITWRINDTHFNIDSYGVITNATFLPIAEYNIFVTVNDTYDRNLSGSFLVKVEDTICPNWIETPKDKTIEFGQDFYYKLNVSDLSGIHKWVINDTVHFIIDNNGAITNIVALSVDVYELGVEVNDTFGNLLVGSFSLTVQDTTSPAWTDIPKDQTTEYGEAFEYRITANDLSGIADWWVNNTLYFSIEDGLIINITLLVVGTYCLEIRAYDTSNNFCSATFKVIVKDTTSPVWITLPSDKTLEYGEVLDYSLAAFDVSGIDHWTVNDTEHFALFNGRLINIGILEAGSYILTVSAYDPYGNYCAATFTITVLSPETPPTTEPTLPTGTPPLLPILVIIVGVGIGITITVYVIMSRQNKDL